MYSTAPPNKDIAGLFHCRLHEIDFETFDALLRHLSSSPLHRLENMTIEEVERREILRRSLKDSERRHAHKRIIFQKVKRARNSGVLQ